MYRGDIEATIQTKVFAYSICETNATWRIVSQRDECDVNIEYKYPENPFG